MNDNKPASNKGYGFCGKCGKPLSPEEIRKGIVMCKTCRDELFQEQEDNKGWV